MSTLSVMDKRYIFELFEIRDGYILLDMYRKTGKNKTFTRDMILEATGINIFSNEQPTLSQQKWVEKLITEHSNREVVKFFRCLESFYLENKCQKCLSSYCDNCEFFGKLSKFHSIMEKLETQSDIVLPSIGGDNIKDIQEDARRNIEAGNYALAIDRLHTYSILFFEDLCKKNNIEIVKDTQGHAVLEKLVADLKQHYSNSGFLKTDFTKKALKRVSELLKEFNSVRNNDSAAHPNELLNNNEAKFVVEIVCNMLVFFKKLDDEYITEVWNF
jgi:hypothetical protein